ncbi:MAG: hypothetical protein B6D64_07530 [Bacteroidetes bacterium 4484_276]|nr:MAG: hypothetical protein B6D64_07530 [Bacteroidetes bacterium 4484_276]OYT12298.1 MAG: hypothetical protein B6I19_10005 [Bacteroidetes bacterium 4572_114]
MPGSFGQARCRAPIIFIVKPRIRVNKRCRAPKYYNRRKYSGALHLNEVSDHLISINISQPRLPVRRTLWQAGRSEAAGRSAAERVFRKTIGTLLIKINPSTSK